MKKINLFLLFLTCKLFVYSQNLILNPGFETIVGNEVGNDQFKNNNVEHWKGFMGTPDVVRKGSNDKKIARIGGSPDNREGIFQENLNLNTNYTYNFKMNVKCTRWDYYGYIYVVLTNSMSDNPQYSRFTNPILPSNQILVNQLGSQDLNKTFNFNFTLNSNYSQIAIYGIPMGSLNCGFEIDDVTITSAACCPFYRDYNNISNPPSTNVQDYIRCNSNVIFNNNSFTDFRARNEIILADNTTISGVETFIASAEDCMAKPFELSASIIQIGCDFKINASACYGSGQYEFYFGEVLSETGNKDYAKENAGSSIVVKVKDIVTGTIISKTITFPSPIVYTGDFTIKIPNVFTPNGDGINDNFRITDNGKTRYAYNAHTYSLHIWNRWGDDVLLREKSISVDDINGFNDQEIYWNGRNNGSNDNENTPPIVSDGTYYYNFSVTNCDKTEAFHGTITLIGGSSFTDNTSLEKNTNEIDYVRKIEISPNPTNDILNVKLFSTKTKTDILITDMLGKPINTTSNLTADKDGLQEYNIDCSGMANGIYFCTVTKGNTLETFKFSVIK